MSKVLIVSKTKMAQQKVCVGGIDIEKRRSIRLMNENGYHETLEECPYNIFDIWDLKYIAISTRPLPHSSEDVNVLQCQKLGILKKDTDVIDLLKKMGLNIYNGRLDTVFNGCLKSTDNGSLFISQPKIPNHSTCFWICDQDIARKNYPADIIPKGSLIRLSLAHWWSPDDTEERCYLQLSGYFLKELL